MQVTDRRRLLVVAYYFPPMGLSGVQRVTKFVKYLPEFGWDPVVLTVDPAGYFAYDYTLAEEIERLEIPVHRTTTWDPTRLFGSEEVVSMPSGILHRVWSAVTDFCFIPDNKIGWKRHAVKEGRRLLDDESFDAIFSSAPPYTAHLVAAELSREFQLPLVTDFRDDWVGNPRLSLPTPIHRRRHRRLEKRVLRQSEHITTINRYIKEGLIRRNLEPRAYTRCSILPHGYDPDDFASNDGHALERSRNRCRFLYSGVFYDAQTPDGFFRGVRRVVEQHPELAQKLDLVFVGLVPESSKELAGNLGIDDLITYHGYVSHDEAVAHLQAADILWMTVGRQHKEETISTSKLYEYMGSRKPILGLVPEGTAKRTLHRYGASMAVDPEDIEDIQSAILALARGWEDNSLPVPDESYVEQFDRRRLTAELAKQLHSVCTME